MTNQKNIIGYLSKGTRWRPYSERKVFAALASNLDDVAGYRFYEKLYPFFIKDFIIAFETLVHQDLANCESKLHLPPGSLSTRPCFVRIMTAWFVIKHFKQLQEFRARIFTSLHRQGALPLPLATGHPSRHPRLARTSRSHTHRTHARTTHPTRHPPTPSPPQNRHLGHRRTHLGREHRPHHPHPPRRAPSRPNPQSLLPDLRNQQLPTSTSARSRGAQRTLPSLRIRNLRSTSQLLRQLPRGHPGLAHARMGMVRDPTRNPATGCRIRKIKKISTTTPRNPTPLKPACTPHLSTGNIKNKPQEYPKPAGNHRPQRDTFLSHKPPSHPTARGA